MRFPRLSIASIGFAVLVLALNFAVVRDVFVDDWDEDGRAFVLLLLPMLNILLIGVYRLRRAECRTPGAIGFLAAGSVATVLVFASCLLAPEAVGSMLRAVGRPIAMAIRNGLARQFGNAAMQGVTVRIAVGIGFEILLPAALFNLPPLAVALAGGWFARRFGARRTIAGRLADVSAAPGGLPAR